MKKIIILLSIVLSTILGVASLQPAQAEDQKVIAIIDTAVDSTKIPGVIYEVCITIVSPINSCPNGQGFQEGKGSANVSNWKIKGIDHGHNMTQAALIAAPDVKVVFVRMAAIVGTGLTMRMDDDTLATALSWVSQNANKFSIDAVSISQSRINFAPGSCPINTKFSEAVQQLKTNNVPVFVATGNNAKTNQVGFPACTTDVVGVGSLAWTVPSAANPLSVLVVPKSANTGPGLDVFGIAQERVTSYRGRSLIISGTSVATVIAASKAVSKYNGSPWESYLDSYVKVLGYPFIG